MKSICFENITKTFVCLILLVCSDAIYAQTQDAAVSGSDFWQHVQFGGGFGVSVGSGYTDITLAPGAIYNFNDYFALGAGLQGSYVSSKHDYKSYIYGGSIVALFNPIEEVQLSLELEEVRVNNSFEFDDSSFNYKDNFWNTGLFVGAGYRAGNVTIGARFNLLFDKDKSVYSDAFMPFVRVYF